MAAQSLATVPARRDYKPEGKPASLSALPFVYRPKRGFKNAATGAYRRPMTTVWRSRLAGNTPLTSSSS